MKHFFKSCFIMTLCLLPTKWILIDTASAYGNWQLIGPGGGGQITSITVDPSNPDNVYFTINVGGARKSTDGGKTWKVINRGKDYELRGKGAHKLMDIAVHPNNSNVLLAAGLNGDIYESINGGEYWRLSFRHPGSINDIGYHFSRFHFVPTDPNVTYITIGSIQKLFLGVSARRTGHFWPKLDTGPTILRGVWSETESTWEWEEVGSIEGEGRGCDEDGCGRYLNIYSIGITPDNPKRLLFVTEKGVYKGSIDETGNIGSFTPITTGLPEITSFHGGKIVFDEVNSDIAYLTVLNLDDETVADEFGEETSIGGVFKSLDGGESWTKLANKLDDHSNYFDIQIDPNDSGRIYVAQFSMKVKGVRIGGNIYRSEDSGNSWRRLVKKDRSNIDEGWQGVHAASRRKFGVHFISVSPNGVVRWNKGGLLCGSDDLSKRRPQWRDLLTVYVGTVDEKDYWTNVGSEEIALAHSIAIDREDSNTVYLPYGDHYYFKSIDGGNSLRTLVDNKEIKSAGNAFDSGTVLIDQFDSEKLYVGTQGPHQSLLDGGVMYSDDGGENWVTIGWHLKDYSREDKLKRGAKTDLLIEYAGDRRTLYVANFGNKSTRNETKGGVYVLEDFDGTTDQGAIDYWNANWKKIFPVKEEKHMSGTCKLAARDDFNAIYVGVSQKGKNNYGLYKLIRTEGGWTSQGPILSGGGESLFNESKEFNDMETDPSTGDVYIATEKGLFVLDHADVITEIDVPQFDMLLQGGIDPEVKAVEIYPGDTNIIYVASPRVGLLRSDDGGSSWAEISRDIPTRGFVVLKVDPNSDIIYAGSPGAGIWKRSFAID